MDSQRLSPGDTGYDPYSDPDSPFYGQQPQGGAVDTIDGPLPPYVNGGMEHQPRILPERPNTTTSTVPHGGNLQDRNYVASLVQYWGSQPGADPSLTANPDYWINKVLSGEFGTDENFIVGKMQNAWKATPPPQTLSGGGMLDIWPGYTQPSGQPKPWEAPSPYPEFKPPTPADVRAGDPSYDFDLNEGIGAMTNSAAARGVARGGGLLRGIESLGTNFADQQFGNMYNRDLGTYTANKQTYDMNTANSRQAYLDSRQAYLDAYGIFNDNRKDSLGQLDVLYGAGANAAGGV